MRRRSLPGLENNSNESGTKVVHCRVDKYDVYIGRGSDFGNPFTHLTTGQGIYVGTRAEAIAKFQSWFILKVKEDAKFKRKIDNLKGKVLGCWCKPGPCHGDVIIKYLNGELDPFKIK